MSWSCTSWIHHYIVYIFWVINLRWLQGLPWFLGCHFQRFPLYGPIGFPWFHPSGRKCPPWFPPCHLRRFPFHCPIGFPLFHRLGVPWFSRDFPHPRPSPRNLLWDSTATNSTTATSNKANKLLFIVMVEKTRSRKTERSRCRSALL